MPSRDGFPLRFAGWFGLLLLSVSGCGYFWASSEPDHSEPMPPTSLSENFRHPQTGRIQGQVLWKGSPPHVPKFAIATNPMFHPRWPHETRTKSFQNSLAPRISKQSRGVGGAVVFLRKVDLSRSKAWDHPPVTVHFKDYQIQIRQGSRVAPVGFVRRGSNASFVSDEQRYHGVRARGAGFFTLTLPTPKTVRTRQLPRSGLVELSSAAEYYWLRGYLFVAEHPYFVLTEPDGKFELGKIPSGEYELVAWMPNWHKRDHDRNPESMCISRMRYRNPVEKSNSVRVEAGETRTVTFEFAGSDFGS